ncbi:LysR substrate-binding domain-containing protein [Actinomadura rugatobispora]|uniref:LysR substrate-binding domain-containing protein n=1 Tax=Actinomadura rugatobispora TaxID=1994 RepID=A0ABW1A776_9ACTN
MIACVFTQPTSHDAGFREIPLREDPVRLAVPAAHPLAGATRPNLADLAEDTWASGCERCRGHLLRACARAGFSPRIAFATDDHIAVQRLVARGLAVTAMPALAFALHREPGVAPPPCTGLGRRRITALVAAGPVPPAVAALLDEIVTVARDAPPTAADPGDTEDTGDTGDAGDGAGDAVSGARGR